MFKFKKLPIINRLYWSKNNIKFYLHHFWTYWAIILFSLMWYLNIVNCINILFNVKVFSLDKCYMSIFNYFGLLVVNVRVAWTYWELILSHQGNSEFSSDGNPEPAILFSSYFIIEDTCGYCTIIMIQIGDRMNILRSWCPETKKKKTQNKTDEVTGWISWLKSPQRFGRVKGNEREMRNPVLSNRGIH